MQPVTKQRLIDAIGKVNSFRREQVDRDGDAVNITASAGLRSLANSAFGKETPAHEIQRVGLELDYLEVPKDPDSIRSAVNRWRYNLARRRHYQAQIFAIQAHHRISGLIRTTYCLGDREFDCWGEDEDLRLIPDDLTLLRSEAATVVANWLAYITELGLDLYVHRGSTIEDPDDDSDWRLCSIDTIRAELAVNDWVKCWETISYISPSRLAEYGYDTVRRSPGYPDDKLDREVHLEIGSGCDRQWDSTKVVCFCACDQVPSS